MYRLTNRAPVSPDVRVSAGQLSSVIGGLLPWRTYEFRIQAYNLAGPGPWTQYSSSRTLPGSKFFFLETRKNSDRKATIFTNI